MPISLRVIWRVIDPSATVESSVRSRGTIHFDVLGPAGPRELVPLAVGMSMYTEGDVLKMSLVFESFWWTDDGKDYSQSVVQSLIEIRRRVCIWPVCGPKIEINGSC